MLKPIRAAACHVAPVFLSAKATTEKVVSLISEAAAYKANLAVFPETFIPAFPIWSSLRPPTSNHSFFKRMVQESIFVDPNGEEVNAIRAAARRSNISVSIGVSEKVRYSSATLFNSNLLIRPDGSVANHHRKLVPTFFEKLVWSPGDGHGLRVIDTEYGKIGNLICGENTNPLARYSLMAQGEQLHISSWPPIWPTRVSQDSSDAESSNPRDYDNVAANRTRAAAHCFEAKCFGILSSAKLGQDAIQQVSEDAPQSILDTMRSAQQGVTMFLDPTGAPIEGFTIDTATGNQRPTAFLQHEEGILYADLDLNTCVEGKQYHDVVGGYQRFDVFSLSINRTRPEPARFEDGVSKDTMGSPLGDDV